MLEFTGERVVPGLVDPNLFNEHLARYRLASQFAEGPVRVLDAGCGSGYGVAQFGPAASVVAIDIAHDAVTHARESFARPHAAFAQASCEVLPFADSSFDLVVAFEVIEHLARWQQLLSESKRVLKPAGVLLVSTPNKTYYAESRAEAGPNPYHVHEFEYDEFATALADVFPNIHLWSQNHAEAIAFVPMGPGLGQLDSPGDPTPTTAHFFLAACSSSPISHTDAFALLPATGNVLRERERHISLLEDEVRQKTVWLDQQTERHAKLKQAHDAVLAELEQHNEWAKNLNTELAKARLIISGLEDEIKANNLRSLEAIARLEGELGQAHQRYGDQIRRLEKEAVGRLNWVHDLEQQIADGAGEIERRVAELKEIREVFEERTQWGEAKAEEARHAAEIINRLRAKMEAIEDTRWMRLGHQLGVVPDQDTE